MNYKIKYANGLIKLYTGTLKGAKRVASKYQSIGINGLPVNISIYNKHGQEVAFKRDFYWSKLSKSKIRYEWHSLQLDNNQDIINITVHDNFIDAMNESIDVNDSFEDGSVELVKYYMDGDDIDGETRSAWCANSLDISELFEDGSYVPQYLKKQVINEVNTWGCEE